MTDDSQLFTGTEDAAAPAKGPDAPDLPLDGTDHINIRDWVADLTYQEVHAFTVGFAPPFLALVAAVVGQTGVAATLWGLTALVLGVAYGTRKLSGVLNKTMRYVVPEPHYAAGGAVLGVLVGSPVSGLVVLVSTPAGASVVLGFGVAALLWLTLDSVHSVADRFGWWP